MPRIKRQTVITDEQGLPMDQKVARSVVSRVIHEKVHDAAIHGAETVEIRFDESVGDGVTLRDVLDLSGYKFVPPVTEG